MWWQKGTPPHPYGRIPDRQLRLDTSTIEGSQTNMDRFRMGTFGPELTHLTLSTPPCRVLDGDSRIGVEGLHGIGVTL